MNLNRSSSVCSMTKVKFDLGSSVPVMSSMVSIYTAAVSLSAPEQRHDICVLTCFFVRSITRSMSGVGYDSNSGDVRSFTHARVNAWRSRVRCGIDGAETELRMSWISSSMFVVDKVESWTRTRWRTRKW